MQKFVSLLLIIMILTLVSCSSSVQHEKAINDSPNEMIEEYEHQDVSFVEAVESSNACFVGEYVELIRHDAYCEYKFRVKEVIFGVISEPFVFIYAPLFDEEEEESETDINKYLGRINYCQKNGDVVPCDEVKGSTSVRGFTPAHIDDPDDEESEWYDWWNDVDGYLLEYDDNFKKIIYDFRDKYGMPKNMSDDLCDKLADVIFDYVKNNLERLGIDPNENTDQDYSEFAHERMVEWLVEPYLYGDFWDDYQGNSVEGCGDIKCATSVKAPTNDSSIVNKIGFFIISYLLYVP